ncbi:MAG: hypothetical protein WBE79_03035 [Candidatus Cybelea sp.]
MHISNPGRRALTASVALAVPAGCSGGGSQMAPNPLGLGDATQSAQGQGAQYGRLNSILALRRGITSGSRANTRTSFNADAVGRPLVFVADGVSNVNIYLQRGENKMVGQITGLNGAYGLATDTAGNLYVATNEPDVLVYAPPYTQAPTLLNDLGYEPYGIAISRLGVVGVANFCNYPSCGRHSAAHSLEPRT